jgi:hypothetical protein
MGDDKMRNRFYLPLLLVPFLVCACTPSTRVIKNPDDCDTGVRFYRSKPYLFIKPTKEDNGKVEISVEYMPDFSEEYSVHIKSGLGINTTNVTLNEKGVLMGLNVSLDSQTAENITALGSLAGSAAPFLKSTNMTVEGRNVPLGFYEAVIGHDGCRNQLYGWRYVGFMPYNKCPISASGGSDYSCCNDENNGIWGLVYDGNKLVFKKLPKIAESEAKAMERILPQ